LRGVWHEVLGSGPPAATGATGVKVAQVQELVFGFGRFARTAAPTLLLGTPVSEGFAGLVVPTFLHEQQVFLAFHELVLVVVDVFSQVGGHELQEFVCLRVLGGGLRGLGLHLHLLHTVFVQVLFILEK